MACCLPYVLSYLSKKESCTSLDLSKPILMLATTEVTLSRLEKKLSTQEPHGAMAFFRDNGFLTESEVGNGAFYRVYSAKSRLDTAKMKEVAYRHEIVLTDLQYSPNILKDCFSAVLVYGNHQLSSHQLRLLKNNFGQDVPIVLFPYAFQENKNTARKSEDRNLLSREERRLVLGSSFNPTSRLLLVWRLPRTPMPLPPHHVDSRPRN